MPSAPLAPAEMEVLGAIDESWLLETLAGLVAIPSWEGRERRAQEYVAAVMVELGMDTDIWEIDQARLGRHPDCTTEIARTDPLGVVGRARWGEGGPTLVLNGHVDVVPPGDRSRWATPPFEMVRKGERVHGRGVVDMKGPLVAGMAGVRAVSAFGASLRGSLLFQSVIGEEDGGLGTLAAVLRGHVGDGAIVLEPTGLSVAAAQAGALNFRLTVPGRAAHGALRYEGVSALEKLMLVYRDLVDFERERNRAVDDPRLRHLPVPYPICVGTVRGGNWASTVPEEIRAEGRFGIAVREDVAAARGAFEARMAACCALDDFLRENPARVEWWGGQFAPCETPADAAIVQVARSVVRDLAVGNDDVVGVPYGSDLRHLVNAGRTPGILFGPGNVAEAHRANESIGVAELVDGARAVALSVLRFLSKSQRPSFRGPYDGRSNLSSI